MIITYNVDLERTYRPKAELPPNPERLAVVFAHSRPVVLLGHIGPTLDIIALEWPETADSLVEETSPSDANGLLMWEGEVVWVCHGPDGGDYVLTGTWRVPTAKEVDDLTEGCWPWDVEQWLAPEPAAAPHGPAISDGATVTLRRTATGETVTVPASPPYMADTMRPDVSLPGEPPEVSMARRDWMAAQHGAAYNGWRPEYPAPVEALRAWLDAGEPLTYPDACALLDEVVYLRGAGGPPASQPEIRGGERAVQTYMTTQRGGGWVAPPVESWAALVTHVDTAVGHRWTLYNACLDEGGYWRGWGDGGIFPGEEIGPFWLLRRPDAQAPTSQPEPPPQPRGGEAHADPCPTCSAPRAVGCWCKGGE